MRGVDLINTKLPTDLLSAIFLRLADSKSDCDAFSHVCRRWLTIDRSFRFSIRLGASGPADHHILLLVRRFSGLRNVYIDERLPASSVRQMFSSSARPRLKKRHLSALTEGTSYPAKNCELNENEFEESHLTDVGLSLLAEGCLQLEKLSLIWCSNVTSIGLESIAKKCKFLKSLVLQGCYIGDQGLIAVGQYGKLEELSLKFCEGLTDTGLVGLLQLCGRLLKYLSIAACAWITDVSMEAVASHCSCLEVLSLDSELVMNKGLISVAQCCRTLKGLKLQCINITDEALEAVGSFCSLLELLALYSFQRFTDRGLSAIGSGCKNLRDLTLTDCHYISDASLQSIAHGCPKLSRLEINGCHHIETFSVEAVGKSCPDLKELALMYCPRIRNSALLEVGRGCLHLQALDLVDCSSIDDDALIALAKGCKNLKKLHIRRCYQICGIGGMLLDLNSTNKKCKRKLNLLTFPSLVLQDWKSRCHLYWVGDEALVTIGQGCSLQLLNVSGCHQITDVGITAIARGCPELTCIDMSILQYLGDTSLSELGKGCPKLREVVLSYCPRITDVGIAHLLKGCTRVETFHMVYCPSVTSSGVATIISSCLCLKKLLVEKWKVSERSKRRAAGVLSYLCVEL